jgi:CheY-like chemotaxis protein
MALGAVGYLVKPVSRADLISAMRVLAPGVADQSSRILVVEDDPVAAESVERLLTDQGLSACHVASAHAAVEALSADQFACMILDLGLPDTDGLEVLDHLRAANAVQRPPIIVYTARALTREETRRLEQYVQAVVLKDGSSQQRLVDELRLFVGHVEEGLPSTLRGVTAPVSTTAVSLRGTKILLADDDMRTAYSLAALLQGRGADVLVAETGLEALSTLAAHTDIRAVLMDIMMPEMDGYEAMRRLRADGKHAHLPIIALTAKALQGERERCVAAGATDYLAKPVDGDVLLQRLDAALKAQPSVG